MKSFKRIAIATWTLVVALCASQSALASPVFAGEGDCVAVDSTCVGNLQYFGGPIMTGTTNIYVIWYGNWGTNTAKSILPNFFGSLTGSDYMNIALTYKNADGVHASNIINYGGSIDVDTSVYGALGSDGGATLTDAESQQLVKDAQTSTALPTDPNAIYFVYTALGIRQEMDTQACGYHSNFDDIKYSWVSPRAGCDFLSQGGSTVSGNINADSLTETTSHELFEAITDPYVADAFDYAPPLGFYDVNYGENGDNCVYTNLAANMGGKKFDVQSIWVNDANSVHGGFCAAGNTTNNVPEPATGTLFLATLGMLTYMRRRRQA